MKNFIIVVAAAAFLVSCKKNKEELLTPGTPSTPTTPTTPPGNTALNMKDSAISISRNIYLWNDKLPAGLSGNSFTDLKAVMEGIRPYSQEPGFSSAVDRWSFAMKQTEWNQMAGGTANTFAGTSSAGDFGMTVFFRVEGDLRIRHAEPYSPAGRAGIRRGWKVVKINGNSNITTSNSNFIVNSLYNSSAVSLELQKHDGSIVPVSLQAGHYQEKPLYLDTVYNVSGKKIGYMVFNSFLGNTSLIQQDFARAFNRFAANGINDIVVDLRYNGGGYVSLQESLANYLAPTSANGQVMMKQIYNSANSNQNITTTFRKAGSVNLPDVYFIVGRGTASASELLINNLKPYMNVHLVGGTTHGKPVGYFPIPVADWYIFPVSFRTTNKNGEGNYFNGFSVNSAVADGLDKDWGDLNETSLASAVRHITTGSFGREVPYSEPASVATGNELLDRQKLKITIDSKMVF